MCVNRPIICCVCCVIMIYNNATGFLALCTLAPLHLINCNWCVRQWVASSDWLISLSGNPPRSCCYCYVIPLMFCCIVENKTLSLSAFNDICYFLCYCLNTYTLSITFVVKKTRCASTRRIFHYESYTQHITHKNSKCH